MDERFGAVHSCVKKMTGNELYVQKQTGRYSPIRPEKSVWNIMRVLLNFCQRIEKPNYCAIGQSERKFQFKNDFLKCQRGSDYFHYNGGNKLRMCFSKRRQNP